MPRRQGTVAPEDIQTRVANYNKTLKGRDQSIALLAARCVLASNLTIDQSNDCTCIVPRAELWVDVPDTDTVHEEDSLVLSRMSNDKIPWSSLLR
jgi:hypothetical protein